jgi:hypothetical protein
MDPTLKRRRTADVQLVVPMLCVTSAVPMVLAVVVTSPSMVSRMMSVPILKTDGVSSQSSFTSLEPLTSVMTMSRSPCYSRVETMVPAAEVSIAFLC